MKNWTLENINSIINGNNLTVLKNTPDNSIDSIITDIPYGLQDINALELIKENKNNTRGFMGKEWDVLPTIEMLKEFYRVLKTGSFFVTTFSPRQDLQTVLCYRLLEAGFNINFSPLYYCFASGFPKACDYSKMAQKSSGIAPEVVGSKKQNGAKFNHIAEEIDNGGFNDKNRQSFDITKPTTEEAKYLEGLKSLQLKPAVEPIMIAQKAHNKAKYKQAIDWYQERKELLESGIKEEDLSLYTKNSSGGVRIDDCRIPIDMQDTNPATNPLYRYQNPHKYKQLQDNGQNTSEITGFTNSLNPPSLDGRFPANILVADDCIDIGRITNGTPNIRYNNQSKTSGIENGATAYGKYNDCITYGYDDKGDLSRYFSLDSWTKKNYPELCKVAEKTLELEKNSQKISPILFLTKPHRGEKDAGLEGELKKTENEQRDEGQAGFDNPFKNRPRMVYNNHPTGKPLALFNYLIHLFSSENDIILDPFCGSGTTCISAKLTKRKYIGIEMDENYCEISRSRLKFWGEDLIKKKQQDLF
jgi:16S rRNA G966 N2-methylase RsmD